jgi:hypothetical protein
MTGRVHLRTMRCGAHGGRAVVGPKCVQVLDKAPRIQLSDAPKPLPCARMCSMGQRASSGRPILTAMSTEKHPASFTNVQSGDVLVSHPTAVREHEISIVPNEPHTTSPTHDAAVSDGRSEADALGVDAWLTEDQTHVVKIASNRPPDK